MLDKMCVGFGGLAFNSILANPSFGSQVNDFPNLKPRAKRIIFLLTTPRQQPFKQQNLLWKISIIFFDLSLNIFFTYMFKYFYSFIKKIFPKFNFI